MDDRRPREGDLAGEQNPAYRPARPPASPGTTGRTDPVLLVPRSTMSHHDSHTPPLAYVIAGSEATGGAGIQADLKTFQELGTYGVGTLTCIVSFDPKNDWGHRFVPVDPQVIADQFEAATSCYDLDVVKIGMLGTPATIDVVAESLASQRWHHVVLDPVLICK